MAKQNQKTERFEATASKEESRMSENQESGTDTTRLPAIPENDRIIWRRDLVEITGCHPSTIARWRRNGILPKPDAEFTKGIYGWKLSTLKAIGIDLPPPSRV